MFLLSVGSELGENKTSDKARNSAKTALAPMAETGIKKTHVHTRTHRFASAETRGTGYGLLSTFSK